MSRAARMYLGRVPEQGGVADGAADPRERLIVVGNGMAGCRAVEEILERDPARYRITIFGAEPRVNYNRIMLSPVLAGEKSFEEIVLNDERWYAANNIELITGDPVLEIDREAKLVRARSGLSRGYERLIVATGSDPFIIPVPGRDLPGVVTFRDLDDVDAMLEAAERGGRAVVIGGGLLGLEAAYGLDLRRRRMRRASGFLLRPRRAAVRNVPFARRRADQRAGALRGLGHFDQAQGLGHRRFLGRRLLRRRRERGHHPARCLARRLQAP